MGTIGAPPAYRRGSVSCQRRIQDHVERRMSQNGAQAGIFKEGRGNFAVHASLSEFHISI